MAPSNLRGYVNHTNQIYALRLGLDWMSVLPSAFSDQDYESGVRGATAWFSSSSSSPGSASGLPYSGSSPRTYAGATVTASEFKKAMINTSLTVGAAALFGGGVWWYMGKESGMAFFSGYLVEQSLSVDNLFVFLLLFNYFKVPVRFQNRVLAYGIYGAMIMRGIMIYIGVAAIKRFQMVTLFFAAILLFSAYKLIASGGDDDEDLENNYIMKISRYFIKCSRDFDEERFFTTENRVRMATPLLLCLVCVELSDFVFAIDSIPAVIGVTHDPFIVYSSNIFAILGLRSLYTLVAEAISALPYLKPAVALVLGFIGGKMIAEYFHVEISTGLSLIVVCLLLGGGVVLSLVGKRFQKGVNMYSGVKELRIH